MKTIRIFLAITTAVCSISFGDNLQDDIATVGLWHMESIYYDSEDIPYTLDDDINNPERNHDLILFRSGLNETAPNVVPGYTGNALEFNGGQFSNCSRFWSSSYDEIKMECMLYIYELPTDLGAAVTYLFTSPVFEIGVWPSGGAASDDSMRLKIVLSSGTLTPSIVVGDLTNRWLRIEASYDSDYNLLFSVTDTTTGEKRAVTDTGSYPLYAKSGDITFGSTSVSLGGKPANRNFRGMIDELKITHMLDVPHNSYNPIPGNYSTIIAMPEVLRWSKGLVALGSDVYFGQSSSSVENAAKLAEDIDGSTKVDIPDLGYLSQAWLDSIEYPCADIDSSGTVNQTDMIYLANSWLQSGDPEFIASTQTNTLTSPSLSASTTYYWRAASTTCNETDNGNVWQFSTGSAKSSSPYPDDNESDASSSDRSITLTWTAGFAATSFDVYFGTAVNPSYKATVTSPSITVSALQPNTQYFWKANSIGPEGTTEGDVWTFTTGDMDAINPSPSNNDTDVEFLLEGIQLDWESVFEPNSYDVYFGTTNPPAFYASTEESTIRSPDVLANTTYYWRIDCISELGNITGTVRKFSTATPAFPSVEGFGRFSKGGRGGSVYHVTNLNDSGTGSLRDAVSSGNRTIVFDVGGQITLSSRLPITSSNLTIAGQTAPGDGISIVGPGISIGSDDLIMRYLRVRYTNTSSQDDAISVNSDCSDAVFDHVSASWGTDEVFSMNVSQDITAQWCTITEGQNTFSHSKGSLLERPVLSMHHCLYAHNNDRNPKNKGVFDYRNNVAYNWGFAPYIAGGGTAAQCYANCIGNYYIAGSDTTTDDGIMVITGNSNYHIYFDDNRIDSDKDGIADGVDLGTAMLEPAAMPDVVDTPYEYPPVTTDSPELAYQKVLSRVGCSIMRDSVDQRVIQEVIDQTGGIIQDYSDVGGPGILAGGTAPVDTDQDGMPDYWEDSISGLSSTAADNNGDIDNDGYTNIEEYLNWLGELHANVQKNYSVDINLKQYNLGFGETATYSVSGTINGTVILLADGCTARFTPATDYIGPAQFDYTVSSGDSMTETVNLLVSEYGGSPLEPVNPTNLESGLDYEYYTGSYSFLPDFDSLAAASQGTINNFDITTAGSDNFAYVFEGYINVPADGLYTFYLLSDEGSKLYISDTIVVNNDGVHEETESEGKIALSAGLHPIKVSYFENSGDQTLQVSWAGAGLSKQLIADSYLYRGSLDTDTTAPLKPSDLWTLGGNGQVTLYWTENSESDLAGYNVYRSTTSGSGYVKLNSSLVTSAAYTDGTASNGTVYHYVVSAVDTSVNESDYSDISSAIPTSSGVSLLIQENGLGYCDIDGVFENTNSGFTAEGYLNTNNTTGSYIDWNVEIGSTGTYTFIFRFANGGSSDRPGDLYADGNLIAEDVSLDSTGGWTAWDTTSTTASPGTGTKTLRLQATTSSGLANIDYIVIVGPDVIPADCQ